MVPAVRPVRSSPASGPPHAAEGIAHRLPAYAGRGMQAELEALEKGLGNPAKPVVALVGHLAFRYYETPVRNWLEARLAGRSRLAMA